MPLEKDLPPGVLVLIYLSMVMGAHAGVDRVMMLEARHLVGPLIFKTFGE